MAGCNMSLGRGKLLQAMKLEVDGKVDDLQHHLLMSCAADYSNQSIENFCRQLAERDEYASESSWTHQPTLGKISAHHCDQFNDSDENDFRIPEIPHQETKEDSCPSSYLEEFENSEKQSTLAKSPNSPGDDSVEDRYRAFHSDDNNKRKRRRPRKKKAKMSSMSSIIPMPEIGDIGSAHIYNTQTRTLNENSCAGPSLGDVKNLGENNTVEFLENKTDATQFEDSENVIPNEFLEHEKDLSSCSDLGKITRCGKLLSVEDGASSRECDNYFDGMNTHAGTSQVQFECGSDELSSNFYKEELPVFNPRTETGVTAKVIGRGQRLRMVVESLPVNSQKEIAMGCDPTYTNQSIENYLEKLRIKYDGDGFF